MKLSPENLAYLKDCAIVAAQQAGQVIDAYANKALEVKSKAGGDTQASQVVTEVDLLCEKTIINQLQPTFEEFDLGLLTEEQSDDGSRFEKDYFWCIDPLDGTLSFIKGVAGYAVSIGLVSRKGESIIGVVYDPVSKKTYSAVRGQGAFRNGENWTLPNKISLAGKPLTLVCDRGLIEKPFFRELLGKFQSIAHSMDATGIDTVEKGGAVMNSCWVLEHAPACYFKLPKPQQGGGSLWDFAAVTCLFNEIGAYASGFKGKSLDLNQQKTTFMNQSGVIFTTDPFLHESIQLLDFE